MTGSPHRDNLSTRLWLVMLKPTVDTTMSAQVRCCVLRVSTGPMWSKISLKSSYMFLWPVRIKEKLRSGEMAVSGDQWPLFLYRDCHYDPEDPWNGLFRSSILVFVSTIWAWFYLLLIMSRHTNISLHLLALSKRSPRPLGPAMLAFMG